jgi:hypothetical protein
LCFNGCAVTSMRLLKKAETKTKGQKGIKGQRDLLGRTKSVIPLVVHARKNISSSRR